MKHLLKMLDLSTEDITEILNLADQLKYEQKHGIEHRHLAGKTLGMIFEKFYRLDAARATNRGGAGLGLAIAKEIVGAHGGSISCESTPEHTVFTIVLPL